MPIKWKWDGKTVELFNEEPSTYQGTQELEANKTFGQPESIKGQAFASQKEYEDASREQMASSRLSALERMHQASPAQKREWNYYMRHALRDLKKGQPAEDWFMGLYNTGGVNIDEDGYTWFKGLSDKDAQLFDWALDQFTNRIGVWYRDETGKEQFNPGALDQYQKDLNEAIGGIAGPERERPRRQ